MNKKHWDKPEHIEWPTMGLLAGCYLIWGGGIWLIGQTDLYWLLPLLALPVALHSSLQHEAIHGHPTQWAWLNTLLVLPAVGLFLPFHRFRDLHLKHHHESALTDPTNDPESPFVDREVWQGFSAVQRWVFTANHTLAGRLILGPMVSMVRLIVSDCRQPQRLIILHWLGHLLALVPIVWWLSQCGVNVWSYALLSAWPGMSVLMLRTYLEHEWHDDPRRRSAVVERGGIFALLFLNNNLHAVHHRWPGVTWYRLPALWRAMRVKEGVTIPRHSSYAAIARRHLFRARGPVVHPAEAQNG